MKLKTRKLLLEIQDDIQKELDLKIGHDEAGHIANYVTRNCTHPIYYQHGFYKNPNYWKGELYPTESTEKDCDYCLVQCLECGGFEGITKYTMLKKGICLKGNSLVIVSSHSFEELREKYLEICPVQSEHQIVKIFQKEYPKKGD